MNSKVKKISLETEQAIRQTIKTNKEIIRQLQLVNQSLTAQLPSMNDQPKEDIGYITDPKYGKKLWYDLNKKAQYEKNKKRIQLVGKKKITGN